MPKHLIDSLRRDLTKSEERIASLSLLLMQGERLGMEHRRVQEIKDIIRGMQARILMLQTDLSMLEV